MPRVDRASATLLAALVLISCGANRRPQPGEGFLDVPGGRVHYRVVGNGTGTPLLLLHGGPGASSRAFTAFERLGSERAVIMYDQLGGGRSERPRDKNLWRIERFVEELRAVRDRLGIEQVHLLGHSWGSMLAVDYMLTRPTGVRSLILAGPALSIPRYLRDVQVLRAQLPKEVQETLARHETAGTTDSAEYQGASLVFYKRHLSRRQPYPDLLLDPSDFGMEVYTTMWGPSEFYATGPLKDYDRTSRLGELKLPVLFTAGRYDETTPEQAEWYKSLVPGAKIEIFENSAHMTMLDEPERYVEAIRAFLASVEK